MIFYIDLTNSAPCFAKSIRKICKSRGYSFSPNNKNYYEVNTDNRTCNGVDACNNGCNIYKESTSFSIIIQNFR